MNYLQVVQVIVRPPKGSILGGIQHALGYVSPMQFKKSWDEAQLLWIAQFAQLSDTSNRGRFSMAYYDRILKLLYLTTVSKTSTIR